ncbi:hypothetical protein M409DRAFT_17993 [Zasmidium cellare ATCC 36951]|uniref:Uncharacterized protein n=1 Tax=Zasmidium cellare ATCC 36951 TaxID=1080233 RepID=A0A6A6D0Z2_ZASCE|nr:uncharacterized protein M409DRAFT_17993 [Zasmidium cellare ATCC 36951]KAF2171759.1 hypothetical protein M409DRAFT_17993 [Zasmidium cellare ATCC 36951]
MRFSNRQGTSEQELNATTADVVLQLGEAKIPIKAEKLLGATVRVSRSHQNLAAEQYKPRSPHERASNDEDKAIEALSRMQEELSWTHAGAAAGGGKYPWSPDDLYPSDSKLYQPTQHGNHHTPDRLRREPSDANLPAYYDPTEQPYYVSQQTSASAVRDMALHKGAPTIFDNIGETPQRRLSLTAMKQHEVSRRSKTTGHGPRPRKLDLVQLFPQPRPSTGRLLSPSRLQHSPSAMTDRADYPLPPLPNELHSKKSGTLDTSSVRPSTAASGVAGKSRTFDEDIFDQHKTNVRRPPKGIQNWFDAFLDTDEDEDEDEEPVDDGPEPQELPADEIQPPAYQSPSREVSRASHKSIQPQMQPQLPQPVQQTRSLDPIRDERQALERMQEHEDLSRYRSTSECHSWDSIQSSHLGQPQPAPAESHIGSNSRAGQSVLSLSDSGYGEDGEDNSSGSHVKDRPTIRDSIMDYRNVTVGAASRMDVQKLHQRPQQLQAIRSLSHESKEMETKRSSSRTSVSNTTPHQAQKPLPMAPQEEMHPTAEQVALRRLNGLSLESSATSNSNSNSEQALRSQDSSELPSDAAHMIAVTEEEMMLLDLMRRKRAMMQQMSFTEGYQLALQTEQQRLAKCTESAQKSAMKALQRKENERRDSQISSSRGSPTVTQSDSDMRRHLSAIRKEQVDERFQIERFLGMSQPQPLSSHPPDLAMPTELPRSKKSSSTKSREPSGELLPATVYSPANTPTGHSPAVTQGSLPSSDDNDSDSVKRRVDHFIATNGAVPPLNTALKTMRKKSSRTPASMPPSPVIEEDHAPPAVPVRSPARTKKHQRDASDQSWQLSHKVSSVSMDTDAEPRDKSPVHPFFSRKDSTNEGEQARSPEEEHYTPLLPSRPGAEFADPNSLQRTQTIVSAMTSSPSMSTMSPISPFSSIISAAAAAPKPLTPQSRQASAYTPDTEYSQYSRSTPSTVGATAQIAHVINLSGPPMAKGTNVERKRPLPPPLSQLNTIEAAMESHVVNKHGSLMSITSAGEDVLAAWKDLGGGSDCLKTKKRIAARPSGGLSEVTH